MKQTLHSESSVILCANYDDGSNCEESQATHDARQILKAIFYAVLPLTSHDLMPVVEMRKDALYIVLEAVK